MTEQVRQQLEQVAETIGQTPATLAAVAVGVWVGQMHRSIGAQSEFFEAMTKQLGTSLVDTLKELVSKPDEVPPPSRPSKAKKEPSKQQRLVS